MVKLEIDSVLQIPLKYRHSYNLFARKYCIVKEITENPINYNSTGDNESIQQKMNTYATIRENSITLPLTAAGNNR